MPRVLEFQTMLNPGALFGIGGGQTFLFLIASAAALVLVFWMFSQTSPRRWALQVALGGILAGALGNMYDRAYVKLLEKPKMVAGRWVYVMKTGANKDGVMVEEYPPREDGRKYTISAQANSHEVGFVRDFIKIPTTTPQWNWLPEKVRGKELFPWVFNVADMLLVGGVSILALHLWRERKSAQREQQRQNHHGRRQVVVPQTADRRS